jgi:hypothetical protein
MGYNTTINDEALGNGGAGNPGAWDIITNAAHDLEGKIVAAFMNLGEDPATLDEIEEETTMGRAGSAGVSQAVAAKYLSYEYPQNVIFEGRYTKLTPAANCTFKVWFLK